MKAGSIAWPWSTRAADPRIALRERDELSDADLEDLVRRLGRLDAGSAEGPWTLRVLAAIEEQPGVVSRTPRRAARLRAGTG